MTAPADKPSIAELQQLRAEMTEDLPTNLSEAETNAKGSAALRETALVLLEIAAAAKALEPELACLRGPLSARLLAALRNVRP